jgi:prepilin-type N-terminal cleavage/methylation domain-containing protein
MMFEASGACERPGRFWNRQAMIIRSQTLASNIGGTDRTGFSLVEVLLALTIFLISLIALFQLVTISGDRAYEVQQQSHAAQLCQSKLAEVVSGAVALSSTSEFFDEDPDWQWNLDAEQDSSITGLWRVQVKVSRDLPDGSHYESTINQMVLDPSLRGSTSDSLPSPIVGSNPSTGSGGGSSGSGSASGGGQGGMAGAGGGGAGMAAGGAGAAPRAPTATAPRVNTSATPPTGTGSGPRNQGGQ